MGRWMAWLSSLLTSDWMWMEAPPRPGEHPRAKTVTASEASQRARRTRFRPAVRDQAPVRGCTKSRAPGLPPFRFGGPGVGARGVSFHRT